MGDLDFIHSSQSITLVDEDNESSAEIIAGRLQVDADISVSTVGINDADSNRINPAKEDGNLLGIKTQLEIVNSLVPTKFDTVELIRTNSLLTSVIYKLLGSTVCTLTLTYTNRQLVGVTRL